MSYRPIVLDANLLSIFTEIGRLNLLLTLLDTHDLHVTPAIVNELSAAVRFGHTHVQEALNLIGADGRVQVTAPSRVALGRLDNRPAWMALGEAECIALCQSQGWVFASFDRKAINYCKREGIFCLTLPAIFAALWRTNVVTQEAVRQIVEELEQGGRRIQNKEEIFRE